MKTREEVEALKANWLSDPIWDIEDTEGFEEYRAELREYRLNVDAEYKAGLPKPCPFCGSGGAIAAGGNVRIIKKFVTVYYVICGNINCNAEGPVDLGESGAIAKWNAAPRVSQHQCHECGRTTDDPHTDEDGEDVCEDCCEKCKERIDHV
jgi:hypothetical protein